ncbi:MAG: alpha/beta hydrolase-fold protein [Eubacteriales bacterium]|nr:alpha/beta hydrolase-fold protein [Eubacteriales bacterium]
MGRIDIFSTPIPQLGHRLRTVRVYLPASYDEGDDTYPVLYLQDGQNLYDDALSFSGHSWRVGQAMAELEHAGATRGIVVVGVDHGDKRRADEYNPWKNYFFGQADGSNLVMGGLGDAYADFLAETLKPLIDRRYRTRPGKQSTAIAGSSFGAVISLYTALKYAQTYACAGVFSAATWLAEAQMLDFIQTRRLPAAQRYFIHTGTREGDGKSPADFDNVYIQNAQNLRDTLLACGVNADDIHFALHEGDHHHEKAWARHFPTFVEWAFGLTHKL